MRQKCGKIDVLKKVVLKTIIFKTRIVFWDNLK